MWNIKYMSYGFKIQARWRLTRLHSLGQNSNSSPFSLLFYCLVSFEKFWTIKQRKLWQYFGRRKSLVSFILPPSYQGTDDISALSWFILFCFQRSQPGVEDPFLGNKELIWLTFLYRDVPSRALDARIASLTNSTIRQCSKLLGDWYIYCQSSAVPLFAPSLSQFLEFLARKLERVSSTINTVALFCLLRITRSEITCLWNVFVRGDRSF